MSKCPGPLIWHDVESRFDQEWPTAGILECACGYIVITGSPNNAEHADTPLLKGGIR